VSTTKFHTHTKQQAKLYVCKNIKWSRYRPGVAQRVGRNKALLFHYHGTRRGWVVSSTPRPHFTPGKDPVPILQEAGWPQCRSGRAENLVPTGIRFRTVQPVVSRYTDWATRPMCIRMYLWIVYVCLKRLFVPVYRIYVLPHTCTCVFVCHSKKLKQSHYRPERFLRARGGWSSQISRKLAHEGGKVVKTTHRPPLAPRKYSLYSFMLEPKSTIVS